MRSVLRGACGVLLIAAAGAVFAAGDDAPVCRGSEGFASAFEGRTTFLWKPQHLRAARSSAQQAPARDALLRDADRALHRGPYTVVDKTRPPASEDLHDYTSLAPYWWPDPGREDGRPYVRRDGEFNPERDGDMFDLTSLEAMSHDVEALALAYFVTDEARYAEKAASLLRVWFLDPATRMNPNLNHAQSIPGRVAGRAEGVIDVHRLVRVVESVGLMAPSDALTAQETTALKAWFGALADWMQTSPIGRQERAKDNNHGVYYDVLLSQFALFSGDAETARRVTASARRHRLDAQIDRRGALPEELARTRSLHYTTWTITAVMDLADLGRCVGVDLWNHPTPARSRLRSAVDFVVPFAGKEQTWPWPELNRSDTVGMYALLTRAAEAWNAPAYAALARSYAPRYAQRRLNLVLPPATGSNPQAAPAPSKALDR